VQKTPIDILEEASKDLLYDELKDCDKEFTKLRTVLVLLKLKVSHGWSDTSFSKNLSLLENYFQSRTIYTHPLTELRNLSIHCH
jgi:hypothetical protein